MKNKVNLTLCSKEEENGAVWAGSLALEGNKAQAKTFSGSFEGPLTVQQAVNYALVEMLRHLKKPVQLVIKTKEGYGEDYFQEVFKVFSEDIGRNNIVAFEKGNVSALEKNLKDFKFSGFSQETENPDYYEII